MRKISFLLVLLLLLLLTACGSTMATGTPLPTSSPLAATPTLAIATTSINQIATATAAPIATATQPVATPTVQAVATPTDLPATATPTVAVNTPTNFVPATATVPPTQAVAPIPTRTQIVSVATPTQVAVPTPTQAVATATSAPTLGSEPSLKEFSSSEAKFKVLLPEKPVMKMQTTSSLIGTINTYEYRLETVQYNEPLKFVITATVYPSRFFNRDDIGGLRSLDEIRDNLLTAIKPASSFEGSVVRGAYIGRILDYQVAGARTLRTEIYPIDSILYTVQAEYSSRPAVISLVDQIFDSFTSSVISSEMWQKFEFDEAAFSIALPQPPIENKRTVAAFSNSLGVLEYELAQPERGVTFTIMAVNYVDRYFNRNDATKAFDEFAAYLSKETGGKVISNEPIKFYTYVGKEIVVDLPNKGYVRTRLYAASGHLYAVILKTNKAIAAPSDNSPLVPTAEEIKRFFLSFDVVQP